MLDPSTASDRPRLPLPSPLEDLTPEEVATLRERHVYRLRFPGRIERVYRRHADAGLRRRIELIAVVVIIGFVSWVALSIVAPQLGLLAGSRPVSALAGMLIVMTAAWALIGARRGISLVLLHVLLLLIFTPLMLALAALRLLTDDVTGAMLVLMIGRLLLPLMLGLRFESSALIALTFTVATNLLPWLVTGDPQLALLDDSLFLLSASLALFYQIDTDKRRDFYQRALIQQLAMTDPLTGVMNRRTFIDRATSELELSRRHGRRIAMLMADLDHFKEVNDTYGHAAGDAVLRSFAQACRQALRATDLIGRVGGEEFAILLIEPEPETAAQVAERLRETIAQLVTPVGEQILRCTVSIGVVADTTGEASVDDMLSRADRLLYSAKSAGRNQIVADTATEPRGADAA